MQEPFPAASIILVLVVFAMLIGLRFWSRTWKQPENTDGDANARTGWFFDPALPRWLNHLLAVVGTVVAFGLVVYSWFFRW
ncbi:MAG: hypothetical protein M3116_04590 [Actinomycetota bacterium]|nr:hypothetical protein [Actinomycetota bacterium]